MKISKEFKVGALVLISGLILYFGFNFLKGNNFFSDTQFFTAVFPDAQGLQPTNPVTKNGVAVGRIETIGFLPEKGDSVEVSFSINEGVSVFRTFRAEISSVPLMGVSLKLTIPDSIIGKPKLISAKGVYNDGDRVTAAFGTSIEQLIDERVMPVVNKTNLILDGLQKIINEDSTQKDVKSIISNLERMTKRLDDVVAQNTNSLTATVKNTNALVKNLNLTVSRLKPVLNTYDSLGKRMNATLPSTITSAKTTLNSLNSMLQLMKSDTGTLGKLMNDPVLYDNMNEMIVDMNFLVADMQANPHRYVNINVFGKKPVDSDIIKRAKPTKISGPAVVKIDLKRNVPDDLKVTFYDMVNKKTFTLQPTDLTSTTFKISIPGDVGIGTHAVGLEWNRNKDTDYVSIVKK